MLRSNPVLGASGPLNSSSQDELVYYYQGVCDDQGYPHDHAHARDQADNLALDASIGACLSEGWVVGLGRPVDTREEAVFGEDSEGVDEEDDDV